MKKIIVLAIAIIVLASTLTCLCACSDNGAPVKNAGLIAHRGLSSEYLDNSEEAYKASSRLGFYGVETDIRFTADGYIVCSHDAEPLGHETLEIERTTYAELTALTLEKEGKTGKICSFRQYLNACKNGGKQAIVELKTEITEEQGRQILSEIDAEYSRDKVVFISFNLPALRVMHALEPQIRGQYLVSKRAKLNAYLNGKEGERTFDVSASRKILTALKIKKIHKLGLEVGVWTVNDRAEAQKFERYGADYITSNYYYGE